ncbi:acyltransferase [Bradyrhizobium sp. 188]|uniref:acyltransferase family protein n=1 Tax=Bradyrhizobium sp. 188 TaxID=2782656 RepID=UPI001FF95D2B|nr:acyltransferase [Bradyrhizobium sp. 188]MCK1503118.1 acyltransferase [Bradyrhizobium sp. 188]
MTFSGPGFYRLILALAVVVHHISRVNLGHAAVYIFFVLSGFWICSMWDTKYSHKRNPYFTFTISRFWRLAPVFVICSALAWLVAVHTGIAASFSPAAWAQEVFSSIFILGYSSLPLQPNTPAWSLDVEMQFYVIAPAIAMLLLWNWRIAVSVCAAISVMAALARLPNYVLPYLIFFATGGAAYVSKWRPSKGSALASLGVIGCLLATITVSPLRDVLLGGAHPGPLYRFNEYLNIVVAITIMPWSIYTTGQSSTAKDPLFGDLSFIIYLLHWPVIHFVDVASGSVLQRLGHTAVALAATTAGALLIWRLVDRPLNSLRSKWVSRQGWVETKAAPHGPIETQSVG